MTLSESSTDELAAQLKISAQAVEEAIRRELLSFVTHRNSRCWRFGDSRNASFRRIDGRPFRINREFVKAESETHGPSWHRLIGIDDIVTNDRRDVLLTPEGSKDALAAFHFADAEGTLSRVGVVAALGTGIRLLPEDVASFSGRRVRIVADADQAGARAAARIAERLVPVASEVQTFSLERLKRDGGLLVKDLFDASRIDYDDFESNRDLWSITDLDGRGERLHIITDEHKFFASPRPLPLGFPEFHGSPVYPVSSSQELEKELQELAVRNACRERDTARERSWQLARDLIAVERKASRKLNPDELMHAFKQWYADSEPYLDPKKTRDDYCGLFLAEFRKVRVPTGGGEALKTALARISDTALPEIPGRPDAPKSWRRLAALHRELARRSANGAYFLSCRDAAKADANLNKDSANNINGALAQLGMVKIIRVGDARPGGKASEFRCLYPL